MKYALFLRGINVNGVRVPMAELRDCLSEMPLRDIKTYLQTGNVTFEAEQPAAQIVPRIEAVLTTRFDYPAHALFYRSDELVRIVSGYPFAANDNEHRYAVLCTSHDAVLELYSFRSDLDLNSEDIAAGERVVYWRVPKGSSTVTTFARLLARPKYKVLTTTRNLNTLEKMV